MAISNRFAVHSTALATFYDLVTGSAKAKITTLKKTDIETSSKIVYARGGRGNPKLIGFSSDKEAKCSVEDALLSAEVIEMLTGNEMTSGVQTITYSEQIIVESDTTYNKVTLTKTPATAGVLINVFKTNADGSHGEELIKNATATTGKYSITGKVVNVDKTDCPVGTVLSVYYIVSTDITAKKASVTSDGYSGTYRIILDVLVTDYLTKKNYAGQIIIPNGRVEDVLKLSFAEDGDPIPQSFNIEILNAPGSTAMFDLIIYDDDLVL